MAGASFAAAKGAMAAPASSPVDMIDDRKAREKGFDIIYEARDLSIPQNERDGMTQARTDLDVAKGRVKESERRIDEELEKIITKKYWCVPWHRALLNGTTSNIRPRRL